MTEYTRKPWRVEQNLRYPGLCDVYDKDGNVVAEARVPEVARLLAAAPGLLAVCKQALHSLRQIERRVRYHDPRTIEALETTIAKATGQNEEMTASA